MRRDEGSNATPNKNAGAQDLAATTPSEIAKPLPNDNLEQLRAHDDENFVIKGRDPKNLPAPLNEVAHT